jgi:hypothetical protein
MVHNKQKGKIMEFWKIIINLVMFLCLCLTVNIGVGKVENIDVQEKKWVERLDKNCDEYGDEKGYEMTPEYKVSSQDHFIMSITLIISMMLCFVLYNTSPVFQVVFNYVLMFLLALVAIDWAKANFGRK